ncbi:MULTISPECIES: helix-hairpin-helix domain-containing protein [unclassified Paraflavitalea]|uniref:helix-hairpin-helix domain-containing protein n=1 Tax=unclassified Paraflavitalea TaxID=2798305 RepID=UPI003D34938E
MSLDNYAIADQFSLLSKLTDIHGGDSFKSRSYGAAAFTIEKLPQPLAQMSESDMASTRGIGASAAKKIMEILETGSLSALQELISQTPPGVLEMLSIKGLGPKKIATIWKEMEIESIGELLYACNENRLSMFKGFGEKTQKNIQEGIEFYLQHQGSFLYAEVTAWYPNIEAYLKKSFGADKVAVTGAYRNQDLTMDELSFVIAAGIDKIKPVFQTAQPPEIVEETDTFILYKLKIGLKLKLYSAVSNFGSVLFATSGHEAFHQAFEKRFPIVKEQEFNSEEDLFKKAGISPILPILRNDAHFIDTPTPTLIQPGDIKGIIHSHSTWSDGMNSIEEMAKACIEQGYEYLVISDHSKAAAYAGGLSEEKIKEQHKEVDRLNKELAPFKIFKSIECDILGDGSMDYRDEILSTFDLVIASVHSNLKMSEEKAMMRLLSAIQNKYTTILGHMTGRLLLSRSGYPVDHKTIIDACAEYNVVIELNAHPRRLDIDWSWIPYATEKGVFISIDPDAHAIEGYQDCLYGVLAAQKGGLTKEQNLSSMTRVQLEEFLGRRK